MHRTVPHRSGPEEMCAHTQMGCVCAHTDEKERPLAGHSPDLAGSRRPASALAGAAGPAGCCPAPARERGELARSRAQRVNRLKPELAKFDPPTTTRRFADYGNKNDCLGRSVLGPIG